MPSIVKIIIHVHSNFFLYFQAMVKAIGFGLQDDTLASLVETYQFLIKVVLMKNESKLPHALEIMDRALESFPTVAEFHSLRATVLIRMERFKDALEALTTASNAKVVLPSVHYNYGLIYSKHGESTKAMESFVKSLQADREHYEAMAELGMAYYRNGKKREGENLLVKRGRKGREGGKKGERKERGGMEGGKKEGRREGGKKERRREGGKKEGGRE